MTTTGVDRASPASPRVAGASRRVSRSLLGDVEKTIVVVGSTLAAGVLLTGVKGLVLFAGLREFGATVGSTYGVLLTAQLVVSALGAGLAIKGMGSPTREPASRPIAARWAGAADLMQTAHLVTAALLVVGGATVVVLLLAPSSHSALIGAALAARLPGLLLIPYISVTSAYLVASHEHHRLLRRSAENTVLVVAAALVLPFVGAGELPLVVGLGLFLSAVDVYTLRRQTSVGAVKDGWRDLARRTGAQLVARLRAVVRRHPVAAGDVPFARRLVDHLGGGADVLVLTGAFAVITVVSVAESPALGAAVAAVLALLRVVVLPIKSYGVAAGKVLATASGRDTRKHIGRVMLLAYVPLGPVAIACVAAPHLVAPVLGVPFDGAVRVALFLIAVEILMEPLTSLAGTALKIAVRTTANLGGLTVSLWLVAVPLVAGGWWTGRLDLIWVCGSLLVARGFFAMAVGHRLLTLPRRDRHAVAAVGARGDRRVPAKRPNARRRQARRTANGIAASRA